MKFTIDLDATESIQDQIPSGGVICFYQHNTEGGRLAYGMLLSNATVLKIRKINRIYTPFVLCVSKELLEIEALDEGS